jgi:5-formyltetrahydrofolate cyclo-ligase
MLLTDEKRQARGAASKARARAHETDNGKAAGAIASRGLPVALTGDYRSVSAFYPYKSEISTLPLLSRLAGEGWTTALPVVVAPEEPLVFRAWRPGEPTVPGVWDIPVPPEDSPGVVPDVLVVPLLAFDRAGYRLGYGGGFYDRTLARLREIKPVVAVGMAYAAQEVPLVPHDANDQRLDFVMTEAGTIRCG